MLLQARRIEENTDPPNFFRGMHQDKFKQLQPPRQQMTPPFHLGELAKRVGTS